MADVHHTRIRKLNKSPVAPGPVVYWMSRDQRSGDNWALLFAQQKARELKAPLAVVFCLVPGFLGATARQYGFMLKGLEETEKSLKKKGIAFYLLKGEPGEEIPKFVKKHKAGILVADFDPLKIKRKWKNAAAKKIRTAFCEVDAHNIVPCWEASSKQEFGAYTLRPKIKKLLPEFLEKFPVLKKHDIAWKEKPPKIDWQRAERSLKIDRSVPEPAWIVPGEKAALSALRLFLKKKFSRYSDRRNDPNSNATSGLSPYLHFGQISAQRVALEVQRSSAAKKNKEAFLEELIVRRELSDNLCLYNEKYDSFKGLPAWAKKTLDKHRRDKREYTYSLSRFENAKTHDPLWNAAQSRMVKTGKMHGYMRMYWGKKILEWSGSPEKALKTAIYLNDKYELDGRDPNGYAGIAWSIGGVHDRPWPERKTFGKIRYMSYNGCKAKFDVDLYIATTKK
ncbi:MAG: deoxyribodipyrimidine photo-lyase [Candidatus Omnitrophota bacterium]|jgi:deoxyribodipyrimidine photo-lyase